MALTVRIALLAGTCAVVLGLGAGPASAGCGGQVRARVHPRTNNVPLVLGDSVMIYAVPELARLGFDANARGCRQVPEALDILRGRKRIHHLPHLVVLALGTNGYVTRADLRVALRLLGPHRILAMVTPRELGGGSGPDAANIRAAVRRNPGRMRLIDWVRYSSRHGGLFSGSDGIHLTPAGGVAFARFIARTVRADIRPRTRRR